MKKGDYVMYIDYEGNIQGYRIKTIKDGDISSDEFVGHIEADRCWDVEKLKTYLEQCKIRDEKE